MKVIPILLAFASSAAVLAQPGTSLSTASFSASSGIAAYALDGNPLTSWSSSGSGQWLNLNLGGVQQISGLEIFWPIDNLPDVPFEIQTTADGQQWTSVFKGLTGNSSLIGQTPKTYTFSAVSAQQIAIVHLSTATAAAFRIAEINVLGKTLAAPTNTKLEIVGVAASSNDGHVPANTIDGSLSTRWSAQGPGQWILWDLGTPKMVHSVALAWYRGDLRQAQFDIHTSIDGQNWTRAWSGLSSGATKELELFNFDALSAHYVAVIGQGNTENDWTSIAEMSAYGYVPATTSPPPANANLPSEVLDLSHWKLTLPVNTSHAGNPDEIFQPELATYQNANYFHVNSAKNGVTFTAPCGGSTTSGSGYPRSELREMSGNGLTEASWPTTTGKHTMIITQAITHLPVVKPHIVAGQIHNSSDDVVVFRLEGQTLFIDINGTTGPTLNSNYKLGEIFTAGFQAENGTISCFYNGKWVYTFAKKTSGCYFKAGAYTQSNTLKGDSASAYGEVIIYGLTVSHN